MLPPFPPPDPRFLTAKAPNTGWQLGDLAIWQPGTPDCPIAGLPNCPAGSDGAPLPFQFADRLPSAAAHHLVNGVEVRPHAGLDDVGGGAAADDPLAVHLHRHRHLADRVPAPRHRPA